MSISWFSFFLVVQTLCLFLLFSTPSKVILMYVSFLTSKYLLYFYSSLPHGSQFFTSINECYRLNVHVTPQFICWNLIPPMWLYCRWGLLDHEGGAPVNGINVLVRETPENFLGLFTMWQLGKKSAFCEPGRVPSLGTESVGTLILNFPRVVRNNSCCSQSTVLLL